MMEELMIPKEFLCETGFGCEHFEINELCKIVTNFNGTKPKSDEEIEEFVRKLAELERLVKTLENKVVPALLENRPLPCKNPNSISSGRYDCKKGLEKIEEAKKEKLRRDIIAKLRVPSLNSLKEEKKKRPKKK